MCFAHSLANHLMSIWTRAFVWIPHVALETDLVAAVAAEAEEEGDQEPRPLLLLLVVVVASAPAEGDQMEAEEERILDIRAAARREDWDGFQLQGWP